MAQGAKTHYVNDILQASNTTFICRLQITSIHKQQSASI